MFYPGIEGPEMKAETITRLMECGYRV